jgi:DNA-binding NarL/FixJ family response regulator
MTAERVLASTAELVRNLYEQVCLTPPPETTPDQAAAAHTVRASAHANGWLAPLAWDDIDTDETVPNPATNPRDIDQIAVERAVTGDGIRLRDLTNAEQTEAVRLLTEHGKSIRDIAEQLATTTRTVSRRRGAIRAA